MNRQRYKRLTRLLKTQQQVLQQLELTAKHLHTVLLRLESQQEDIDRQKREINNQVCTGLQNNGWGYQESTTGYLNILEEQSAVLSQTLREKEQAWKQAKQQVAIQNNRVESLQEICKELLTGINMETEKQNQNELLDVVLGRDVGTVGDSLGGLLPRS